MTDTAWAGSVPLGIAEHYKRSNPGTFCVDSSCLGSAIKQTKGDASDRAIVTP